MFFMALITQGEHRRRVVLRHSILCIWYSGRLPYTIAKDMQDYPAQINENFTIITIQIPYSEGLYVDYRHFDAVRLEFCCFLCRDSNLM
jgi:hypothetical protein